MRKRHGDPQLQSRFARWLDGALGKRVPSSVVAFNFNLYEAPFRADVVGSIRYDPESSDWACEETFVPRPRFFDFPKAKVGLEWEAKLEFARQIIQNYLRESAHPSAQRLRSATIVTVGFVDGDLIRVCPSRKPRRAAGVRATTTQTSFLQILPAAGKSLGVGRSPRDSKPISLPDHGRVRRWRAPTFELLHGDFPDLLATDILSRVCSSRMKDLVSCHAASTDVLQWLPIRVVASRETRDYHVLHFPEPPDVLDQAATLYVDDTDHVIKPIFRAASLVDHSVFTYSGNHSSWFVSAKLRDAMKRARLTGITYTSIRLTE